MPTDVEWAFAPAGTHEGRKNIGYRGIMALLPRIRIGHSATVRRSQPQLLATLRTVPTVRFTKSRVRFPAAGQRTFGMGSFGGQPA